MSNMPITWDALQGLTRIYGESFYLIDLAKFQTNYLQFLQAFQEVYLKSQIAYSYKTNYIPRLCQSVQAMGGYAEVVSGMEYELALRIGVPAARIIFNGPYKRAEDFTRALMQGAVVNLDSFYEVERLKALATKFPQQIFRIGIRCNFEVGAEQRSRFGFDVDSAAFQELIRILRKIPNCRIVGLHCHYLAPQRSADAYKKIAVRMLDIALTHFTTEKLEFIDLGGGFFSRMGQALQQQFSFAIPSFAEYGQAIAEVFAESFPQQDGPELILEPGISIVADVMQFVAQVIDVKSVGNRGIALLAGSIYDIKPTLTLRNLPICVIAAPQGRAETRVLDLVGTTCMENDCLYQGFEGELKAGDYVVFDNVGAYTNVLRPPFINPALPILALSRTGNIDVVRRRENMDDVFASYVF